MKYSIITNPQYTYLKVGISMQPDNEIFRRFIGSISPATIPDVLLSVARSEGFGAENATLTFYSEMDWEDKADLEKVLGGQIKDGEVKLYLYAGKANYATMPTVIMNKILYDYAVVLLTAYANDPSVPSTWERNMKEALAKLELVTTKARE
jgi:hypothetical protein